MNNSSNETYQDFNGVYEIDLVPKGCLVEIRNSQDVYKKENIRKFARSIFTLGHSTFSGSYIVINRKECERQVDEFNKMRKGLVEHKPLFQDFLTEYLTDSIRICTGFENYFKYKLLSKGYIIHKMTAKKNVYPTLELSKPVELDILLELNNITEENINQPIKGMRNNTYSLSQIINPENEFNKVLKAPSEFFEYLTILNEFRNTLHSCNIVKAKFSKYFLDILRRMELYLQGEFNDEMNSAL
jgi:hypothetical protein